MQMLRYVFSLFIIAGCRHSIYNCCEESSDIQVNYNISISNSDTLVFNFNHFKNKIQKTGYYANFGFQFLEKNDSKYIMYLNSRKDSLIFVNLFDKNDIRTTSTSGIIDRANRYCNAIVGDTLHLVNSETFQYFKCFIDSQFNIKKVLSLNIKKLLNSNNYFLASNILINNKIAYSYPYLFLLYGMYGKKNGMDSKSILKIDVINSVVNKIHEYPVKYQECSIRENYPIVIVGGNNIFTVFQKADVISKISISTGLPEFVTTKTDFINHYMCYNEKAGEDLAYSSKYDLNDENNFNLIINKEKFLLIKRLRKNSKRDDEKCAVLMFSKNLEFVKTYYVAANVFSRLSFSFQDGIAFVSSDWSKLYYYDLSKL